MGLVDLALLNNSRRYN